MKDDWILDVLADLRAFARSNGLIELAEQLEDSSLVAAAELTSRGERPDVGTKLDNDGIGQDPGIVGTSF